jgi:hypothetical protein
MNKQYTIYLSYIIILADCHPAFSWSFFATPQLQKLERFTFLIISLNQKSLNHLIHSLHRFPIQIPTITDCKKGITCPLMSEFQRLGFMVFPKHIEHLLGLHKEFPIFLHKNFLYFINSSNFIIFANFI